MRRMTALLLLLALMALAACAPPGAGDGGGETAPVPSASSAPEAPAPGTEGTETGAEAETDAAEGDTEMRMNLQIGESTFTARLADTGAARSLAGLLEEGPLTLELSAYGGFEQVGALGTTLPASDSRITTTAGDIVLYQADQIVLFYGSNTWSYTRLGRVEDLTGWEGALSGDAVTVTLSLPA